MRSGPEYSRLGGRRAVSMDWPGRSPLTATPRTRTCAITSTCMGLAGQPSVYVTGSIVLMCGNDEPQTCQRKWKEQELVRLVKRRGS